MPRSVYYYHLKVSGRSDPYQRAKECITEIFHTHQGRYGYRRVQLELRNQGQYLNHKAIQRLMGQLQLKGMTRKKRYRSYRGDVGKTAANVLSRNFDAHRPNEKWVTDITEFNVNGQKVYLSPILDLYNREIVSYQVDVRPQLGLVMNMLSKALMRLSPEDHPVLHSDQGWHYQMNPYQKELKQHGVLQSMSRKGNCLDNAVIENWFGILKNEFFYKKKFASIEIFKKGLEEYIHYYNHDRIKQKLKGLSPVQYRTQSLVLI